MTTFIDDSFPHSHVSIGDIRCVGGKIPTSFLWLRPEQVYTKDGRTWPWTVFRDPRSSDIEQGCLGDCWLLSAMALIAERPDILDHILITKEYSHFDPLCFQSFLFVDDFFPCRIETRSIAFADGRKNQLWVPLIEKALAKQLGSYSRLLAGRTVEGLAMLTGASVEVISLEDDDNSDKDLKWTRILSAKEAGFIMGCSCGAGKREVNAKDFQKKGLLARHAYSILEVKQEGEHRLLKLRNPWGSFVWNGKWSNNWKGWPKELKRKLLSGEPSTGTFWISYEDFLLHFDSGLVVRLSLSHQWVLTLIHYLTTLGNRKIDGCLVIHSSKPIFADMLPCAASVYTDSLVQLVLKEGTVHSSLPGVYPRYVTNDFAGLLLMVDNALDDMWVHVRAECSNSLNVLSSRGALDVADSIPPLSRQVLVFENVQIMFLRWGSNVLLPFPGANAFTTAPCGSFFSPFSQLVFYLPVPSTISRQRH
ncbi:unnamed protein product [Angiostrongylus costaricensis]|uniref:Calpain catalytic domain-containing protein n=1 Tax=Angiostrongylus costaricensis TaxID=334426 RepID=A0A0R3Q0I6_ANGCS|nr:unnamed protein product [Angiostrongylus costaricensis]